MELKCFQCDHDLIMQDSWMASDIGLVDEEKELSDDDFMVYIMDCPYCGMRYEVAECPESEKDNYHYYTNND